MDIEGGRIARIFITRNPDKLSQVAGILAVRGLAKMQPP